MYMELWLLQIRLMMVAMTAALNTEQDTESSRKKMDHINVMLVMRLEWKGVCIVVDYLMLQWEGKAY